MTLRKLSLAAALAVVIAAFGTAATFAGEEATETVTENRIEKRIVIRTTDGDDGDDGEGRSFVFNTGGEGGASAVFVGSDGEVHELGDGTHAWVSGLGNLPHFEMFGKGGFLGVHLTPLTPELRGHFGVAEDSGVMVGKVVEDSAAARAGLRVGDIITEVNGESVGSQHDLMKRIGAQEPGTLVSLGVMRGGDYEQLTATLGEREAGALGHHKVIRIECEGDGDCGELDLADLGCEGGECEVQVRCDGDGCACEVNGEAVDCDERFHLLHLRR